LKSSNDHWLKYALFSGDPGVTFVAIIMCFFLVCIAIVAGAIFAVPFGVGFAIFKWVQWQSRRPTPTGEILSATQQHVVAANFPDTDAFVDAYAHRLYEAWEPDLPAEAIGEQMLHVAAVLYDAERLDNPLPPIPPTSLIEEGRYRDRLLSHARKCADAPVTLSAFSDALSQSLSALRDALPRLARETPDQTRDRALRQGEVSFTVPVLDLMPSVGIIVGNMVAPFFGEPTTRLELFFGLRRQLEFNVAQTATAAKAVMPEDFKGTPRDIVDTYLSGTPLAPLFDIHVPFAIPDQLRFEHMHVIGGSGHGKTQLLQHLILNDLAGPDPPSMVIIDSQGDMLSNISHLKLFERLGDRLIIIDPRDVEHPPALNMFDVNLDRINRYGAADREQILNGVVELYEYFFGSLLGAELTQKQSLVFRYLARLLIQIPSANLRTMIGLMDDLAPYRHIIAQLPESSRMFFEREFTDRQFGETRTQVKRRLYGIIENQTFERMFSAPRNRIDLSTALNEGKIVLVNTAKDFLKSNSSILGRYFIALTLQAALERAAIPERKRRPAFLYIDEASEYFDTNIDNLLTQARKYKLGIVVAHQYLDQLQGGLRSSFAANTGIKMVGGISDRDAHAIASDMRTTPSFILGQHRDTRETRFACYLRNMTTTAISISVPLGAMEREPRMASDTYEALLNANRGRISGEEVPASMEEPPAPEEPAIEPTQPELPAVRKKGSSKADTKPVIDTAASPEW
jgi:hypothetical protein